jgi:hypothetical protein
MILNSQHPHIMVVVSRLVIVCLLLCAPGYARALDLETVLENTAITAPARVAFREERHNPMFKEPIVLTGYLEYLKPGYLRKVIETPFKESFLIADDHIEISRDGKVRRLSLRKGKPIQAMLGGIEALLAGQMDKLDSVFRYELTGTSSSWSLRLEPRSRAISSHLASMLVKGDEDAMSSIRVDMEKGEWSLMDILHVKVEP